jgi:hypothetical protein
MAYSRTYTIDAGPTGDTVKAAIATKLDGDLTNAYTYLNAHDVATTNVHGLGTAYVVGTTTAQTLTNKTISSPTITGGTIENPTLTGTVDASGATISSPTITGGTATNLTLVTPTLGAASGTSLTLSGLTASLPVFSDGSKALVSKSVADTLTALGVGAWTDYSSTSTIAGFSSYTVKQVFYKVVEKNVFVTFFLYGVADGTGVSFTLPLAILSVSTATHYFAIDSREDSTYKIGRGALSPGSVTVSLYPFPGENWNASLTPRHAAGQFFYQIA